MSMTPKEIMDKVPPIRTPGSIEGLKQMMQHIPEGAAIAEIGCYAGESTEILASTSKTLVCVDPFDPALFPYCPSGISMADVERAFQIRMSPWRKLFELRDNESGITHFKETSKPVSESFNDGTFDLVYIDADHFYPSVCADIQAWLPKVKDGGFIGGHDYNDDQWRPEVNRAIDELLGGPDMVFPDCSWLKRITAENREHFIKFGHIDGPGNEGNAAVHGIKP